MRADANQNAEVRDSRRPTAPVSALFSKGYQPPFCRPNEEIGDSRTEHGARGDIGADTAAQRKPSCILLGRRARRSFGAIAHRRDRDAYEPLKIELKLGETAEIV